MCLKRNHLNLPSSMYISVEAAKFSKTTLIYQNIAWSKRLGLEKLLSDNHEWVKRFARFIPLEGSFDKPLALCYHGHQFGVYNPDIGDGRGFLYAQIQDPVSGNLLDFGTKGSGQTPFSRSADGRLTLKGAVREILASEMLDALGVKTSKTFSVIETGEELQRQDEPSPTRSAVLVRLSHGHIRIGSFQRLAFMGEAENIEVLLRYVLKNYCVDSPAEDTPLDEAIVWFIRCVAEKIATLTASWMAAGFVHGVLNTDNYNITGEGFDYGPWRFLPRLEPEFTAAYFDYQGRYCYGRQPEAGFWALCRLADCFVTLISPERLEKAVGRYYEALENAMVTATCGRLGVDDSWDEAGKMVAQFMAALRQSDIGFEDAFFDWYGGEASERRALVGKRRDFYNSSAFAEALPLLSSAPTLGGISRDHAYFAGDDPVTMLIDEVEAIWEPIALSDDWSKARDKIAAIHVMADAYRLYAQKPQSRIRGVLAGEAIVK